LEFIDEVERPEVVTPKARKVTIEREVERGEVVDVLVKERELLLDALEKLFPERNFPA
jgi:hypothetical protein